MAIRRPMRIVALLAASGTLALAFKPYIHQQITNSVLSGIVKTVNGKNLKFTSQAITEVSDANKAVDCGGNVFCLCYSCQADSSRHFDDENFSGGSGRLVQLRQKIIKEITASSPDGATGRQDLGAAFHTLQDFYAHSNRVEAGLSTYDSLLGQSTFNGLPDTTPTCPANSSTLGGAGLTSVTSGYFPTCSPANQKCAHGFLTCSGINKDDPSRPNYATANSLATTETKSFVNSILNDPAVTNNEKAIRALMGIKSTLGFVIDTTGSMGDIIGAVQAEVVATVNSVVGTSKEPDQYLLEPYNDPNWGPPFTTDNAADFIAAVNALGASGGGDCPELPMHGLLDAISASYPDSQLYLYTDASAKDGDLASGVIAAAQAKNISGNFFNFGSCSPIDPSYVAVANATGGQAFFLARSEAGTTFHLIQPQLGALPAAILVASGAMGGSAQNFNIPIDSTVTSATFSISVDVPTAINLLRPSGVAVNPADPDVTFTSLSSGEVVTIAAPAAGAWTLDISGSGDFSVYVEGSTSVDQVDNLIRLNEFEFVALAGRPAHQGYYQIAGQPVAGASQTGLAVMQGPFTAANFELLSQSGSVLQPVVLAPGDPNAAPGEYVGSFSIPAQSFRLAVTGADSAGNAFQRVFPVLFTGESVSVVASNTIDALRPGSTTTLPYTVTNTGPAGSFNIIAADNKGFVSGVAPPVLTLPTGGSGNVMVQVTVPLATPLGTAIALSVTATSATDATVTNTAVQSLLVEATADTTPPAITASASPSTLWPPNGQMVPVVVSGTITDMESGVDLTSGTYAVTDEYGSIQPSGSLTIGSDGAYSFTVSLQASRLGDDKDGRQYTITVFAKDNAGNLGSGSVSVTAPHDQR